MGKGLAFWLLLLSCWPARSANAQQKEIHDISDKLSTELTATGKRNIAVVDFTDLEGCVSELGRFMAEEFSASLAEEGKGFQVVDRTNLNVLIKENHLAEKGIIDSTSARRLGQVAGVDALVTGTLTPVGDTVHISIKVLDASSARIITATRGDIVRTKAIDDLLAKGVSNCNESTSVPANSISTQRSAGSSPTSQPNSGRGVIGVQEGGISNAGLVVSAVNPGGPAARAGLKPGDVIVSADGRPIKSRDDVNVSIGAKIPGSNVLIGYLREGRQNAVTVTVAERSAWIQFGDIVVSVTRCNRNGDRISCVGSVENIGKERRDFDIRQEWSYMVDNVGNQSKQFGANIGTSGHEIVLEPELPIKLSFVSTGLAEDATSVSLRLSVSDGTASSNGVLRNIPL